MWVTSGPSTTLSCSSFGLASPSPAKSCLHLRKSVERSRSPSRGEGQLQHTAWQRPSRTRSRVTGPTRARRSPAPSRSPSTGEAPLDTLREELGRLLERSRYSDTRQADLFFDDARGHSVKLLAMVTATSGDTIAPLCREIREGLVTFLAEQLSGRASARPI